MDDLLNDSAIHTHLRQLQDRLDLQDLVNRYAQMNDYALEPSEVTDLFTDDAVLVGVFRDEVSGADALHTYANSIIEMRRTVPYRHHVSNIMVTARGDEACMTCFILLVYRHPVYDGSVQLHRVYYGNLEFFARRTEDGWRISRRTVRLDPT
jgi:ketosteroid isomerase-like protein